MKRRITLLIAVLLIAGLALPMSARAAYPDRPITLVLPLGPGGSHDLHARGITSIIADILGQPMLVKFVPGSNGMKGTGFVARAKPDGYTILFTHNAFDQISPQLRKVPFNTLKDLTTIAKINHAQTLLAAPVDRPYKTLKEFIAHAKKNPGKMNVAHAGAFGVGHMPELLLAKEAGISVAYTHHKGGGAILLSLLAGRDDAGSSMTTQARPQVKAGKLRVLAIFGDKRLKGDPVFENVPTTVELGYPSATFTMDRVFMAPSGTPPDRLKTLRTAFEKLTDHKSFKRFMRSIGNPVIFMKGEEYDKIRVKRYPVYGQLIKSFKK